MSRSDQERCSVKRKLWRRCESGHRFSQSAIALGSAVVQAKHRTDWGRGSAVLTRNGVFLPMSIPAASGWDGGPIKAINDSMIRTKIGLAQKIAILMENRSCVVAARAFYRVFGEDDVNSITRFVVFLSLIVSCSLCNAADIPCAAGAMDRAKQLLTFHSGPDERMKIDETVKQLPSMHNPAEQKQEFEVLEIWGNVYKGRYRMRFIYYTSPVVNCVLMGEEILEYARM
jgi:hypothetical protein